MSFPMSLLPGPGRFRAPQVMAVAAGAFLMAGCSQYSITVPDPLEPEEVIWASALGIHLSDFEEQDSGLWIRVDRGNGEGEPAAREDRLVMEYDGWLPSGLLFDSSHQGPQAMGPLTVILGVEPLLIQGFEEGVTGMRVNEVRTLLIPPALGYGPRSSPIIPPNSWLMFRVELLELTPA